MANNNIFRKATDRIAQKAGYVSFQKAEKFKTISLGNTRTGIYSPAGIAKNGLTKPGNVSFRVLRQLSKHDAVVRICINVIKKEVSQSEWEIVLSEKAPDKDKPEKYEAQISKVFELFEYMNANGENVRIMLDRILEDLLTLDAAAIEKVWSLDGKSIVALNAIDAATIRPIYNEYGELGEPAYVQVINSQPKVYLNRDELVYLMANPQNDIDFFGYGLSPIESILLAVQASLEADMYNIKQFTRDNIPPGILDLGDMQEEDALNFIATWNATVIGNSQAMKFVWGGADKKFMPLTGNNKDMQYVEYVDWLSRVKLAAFGLTGMDANITQDINKGTANIQKNISDSRGVKNTKRLVEEAFTRQIIRDLGEDYKYIEFKFKETMSEKEKLDRANSHKIYVEAGILLADEVREELGRDPIDSIDTATDPENIDPTLDKMLYE